MLTVNRQQRSVYGNDLARHWIYTADSQNLRLVGAAIIHTTVPSSVASVRRPLVPFRERAWNNEENLSDASIRNGIIVGTRVPHRCHRDKRHPHPLILYGCF